MTNGVGVFLRFETCRENGWSHRYCVPKRVYPKKNAFIKFCRCCSKSLLMELDEKNGEIVETVMTVVPSETPRYKPKFKSDSLKSDEEKK